MAEAVKTEEAEPAPVDDAAPVYDVGKNAKAEQAEPVPLAPTSMRVPNTRQKLAENMKEEHNEGQKPNKVRKKKVKKEVNSSVFSSVFTFFFLTLFGFSPSLFSSINVDEAEAPEAPSLAVLHAATLALVLDHLPPAVQDRQTIIHKHFKILISQVETEKSTTGSNRRKNTFSRGQRIGPALRQTLEAWLLAAFTGASKCLAK